MFLLTILKDLFNLHYKKNWTELRNFFSLKFQWLQHDICQLWWHHRSLETESGTSILQKPKQRGQYFNWNSYQIHHIHHILDQIHHIRNNRLGAIFFSPGDSHTKGLLVLLHPGLDGIAEVDTNPKGGFVSFKVTPHPLMTEFSMFIPLQGIAPGNSWLEDVFLKDYKIIWKIKMRKMKTK